MLMSDGSTFQEFVLEHTRHDGYRSMSLQDKVVTNLRRYYGYLGQIRLLLDFYRLRRECILFQNRTNDWRTYGITFDVSSIGYDVANGKAMHDQGVLDSNWCPRQDCGCRSSIVPHGRRRS